MRLAVETLCANRSRIQEATASVRGSHGQVGLPATLLTDKSYIKPQITMIRQHPRYIELNDTDYIIRNLYKYCY